MINFFHRLATSYDSACVTASCEALQNILSTLDGINALKNFDSLFYKCLSPLINLTQASKPSSNFNQFFLFRGN